MFIQITHQAAVNYELPDNILSPNGTAQLADYPAVVNLARYIGQTNTAEMNALALINQINLTLIEHYMKNIAPGYLPNALQTLFVSPAIRGFNHSLAAEQNDTETIQQMIVFWVSNRNPAAMDIAGELFSESDLSEPETFLGTIKQLNDFSASAPKIQGLSLIEMLMAPVRAHPHSLFDQLAFVRDHWTPYIGSSLLQILTALDIIKEEFKDRGNGTGGSGPIELPIYNNSEEDNACAAFSADWDWMPNLVLIAKNIFVWLDQLSKQYGYAITRLDEIPDQELRNLADEGITGLWLIGLWERSKASRTIKQWCGNPEALASAYSLADYRIARELGGEDAFARLREQAARYGIRLASDMVPNHMGIDSEWVIKYPERFISLNQPPYPSYTFNSGNLSSDPNIDIRIEDHYYTRQDCAVVFKRVDKRTGETRYIYHGNDGTSMPWNDTAQLNYLIPEVRETVYQTILQVARLTPIIRFDAAMTLAKKHYQRLWFPQPGTGGDIPSRAQHAMTKEEFDKVFPREFWREVVDRIAVDAPGTLLLAEAFWLMESYFVRTLGMHRVYNSAFMNLLRDEDNTRYRMLIKNTLEFDPQILKRYVNFMNNPDERTAVDQFGKGDKYFGICLLMCTFPGLPMIGHGQIQGYTEKYGMEYRKAYYDESPDYDLIHRHDREIFPLLHMRARFSDVQNFHLFNFANEYGNVDENVYAYSNYADGHHTLIVYNNRYNNTNGYICHDILTQTTLSRELWLDPAPDYYVVFHDHIRGEYFVYPSAEICEHGLFLQLNAYQYYAFDDIYQVQDNSTTQPWGNLARYLDGKGTHDLEQSMREAILGHIFIPYRKAFHAEALRGNKVTYEAVLGLAEAITKHYQLPLPEDLLARFNHGISQYSANLTDHLLPAMSRRNALMETAIKLSSENPFLKYLILIAQIERLITGAAPRPNIHTELSLQPILENILSKTDCYRISPFDQSLIVNWLYNYLDELTTWKSSTLKTQLSRILEHPLSRTLLKVNEYDHIVWFNKEAADLLIELLRILPLYLRSFDTDPARDLSEDLNLFQQAADLLQKRLDASAYHFELLLKPKEGSEA